MLIDRKRNTMGKKRTGLSVVPSYLRGIAALLMILFLCQTGYHPAKAASPEDWYDASGTYNQEDGSQYNSGKLQLLPLDDGNVLFELDVMQGSEAEDFATDFRLPGTFYVEEDGTGIWEEETETGMVTLWFVLDGDTVTVAQFGTLPVPVEGTYIWLEDNFEATPEAAGELLEGLATATTSLNHNNGEYRLEMSDLEVDGWFYDMKAGFADTGALIGEFLIAHDLSAVYRIDTDEPILIYGSADSMMAAVRSVMLEEGEEDTTVACAENDQADADFEDGLLITIPLVDAVASHTMLAVGETANVIPVTPGNVPAMITCTSENPEIAAVDAEGTITGIAPGTAVISGTISVDGSERPFSLEISVWAPAIQALDIQTSIQIGETVTMNAQPIGVTDPISWSVSNTDLAEIDAAGVFTGKKAGQVTLTAQSGELKRQWIITIGTVAADAVDAANDVPSTPDTGGNEAENTWLIPVLIIGALLVIGIVVFVLVKQKRKNHNP